MAFRPTISVCFNGKIADIGYYRNWYEEHLLIEAIAIAMIFRDCRTLEEFRERRFGRQDIRYVIEPETWENTDENLITLEQCSEMPISVDLTNMQIYCGYASIPRDRIMAIPEADTFTNLNYQEYGYYHLLRNHRIALDKVDFDEVEMLFRSNGGVEVYLSKETKQDLKKYFEK